MQIIEISKKKFAPASEADRIKSKTAIDKLRKDGEKLVDGVFEFVDAQGGWLDFSYRFFPGDPIRTVKITHGEKVSIPLILARHLNNVYRKVRTLTANLDERGRMSFTKTARTRFTPTDMLTDEFSRAS